LGDLGMLEKQLNKNSQAQSGFNLTNLTSRLKSAIKTKLKTKYAPMSRFEDIGKSFHQRDTRILWIKNFVKITKTKIRRT
jgi:hypothetical protein